jgi:hypothetical protein
LCPSSVPRGGYLFRPKISRGISLIAIGFTIALLPGRKSVIAPFQHPKGRLHRFSPSPKILTHVPLLLPGLVHPSLFPIAKNRTIVPAPG